jgi:hypothetical protein
MIAIESRELKALSSETKLPFVEPTHDLKSEKSDLDFYTRDISNETETVNDDPMVVALVNMVVESELAEAILIHLNK